MKNNELNQSGETVKKLSFLRLFLAILIICAISVSSFFGFKWLGQYQQAAASKSWFAPYVDVTATPAYDFEQLGTTSTKNVVLAFIVSSPTDPCIPTWGAVDTPSDARANLDLDRRIARLRQQGGDVAISFGGLLNSELALKCSDETKLFNAYKSIVERYDVNTIDLDLENAGLTDLDAAKRRATVIAKLQKERRLEGKSLAVWLTLPVAPFGLTEDGTNAVTAMLKAKVDLAGINVMTMDYGQSRSQNQSMQKASEDALGQTHRQLGILYKQAGIDLNGLTLWKKIGATVMIGQNDSPNDVFSLNDAVGFNKFAQDHGVGRMSMWSANRDLPCGGNYVDVKVVSDSCSGVVEDKMNFIQKLSPGFDGDLKHIAKVVTTQDKDAGKITPDDPDKSPYQIWKVDGAYLSGTKVVWHHNVYEAKWWTQGEIPDNPVLQSWQTPWQLVGPVLPNEKPIKLPTLPAGTYPDWSGDNTYEAGDRVLFMTIAYQAKWWNKGESPAASSSNADSSPWVALTSDQIKQILKDLSGSN